MKVVILAGGKGRRLRPYTNALPKPLVPIGDKPILEIVIKQLAKQGFKDIIISVGHLADMIQDYFKDGSQLGVSISYAVENSPLGTAGPLSLVKDELDEAFILMNGDTLSTIDYRKVFEFHRKKEATATIVLKGRHVLIDYGVVEMNDELDITGWSEKPTFEYTVSTGVYVLEPEALEFLPPNTRKDLPDLIKEMIAHGKKVKGYLFDDYWMDIGRPEDYMNVQENYEAMGDKFEL
jgi:NDP-sugar pyrophosphorylase family protein